MKTTDLLIEIDQLRSAGDVAGLLARLRSDPGSTRGRVRMAAASELGEMGDPQAIGSLAEALLSDPAMIVRSAAAKALGEMDDPSALSALHEGLMANAHEPNVAINTLDAIGALGHIADPAVVPELVEALSDSHRFVRLEAAEALAEIGDPTALVPMRAARKRTRLLSGLGIKAAIIQLERKGRDKDG